MNVDFWIVWTFNSQNNSVKPGQRTSGSDAGRVDL